MQYDIYAVFRSEFRIIKINCIAIFCGVYVTYVTYFIKYCSLLYFYYCDISYYDVAKTERNKMMSEIDKQLQELQERQNKIDFTERL
jgi:hypothetical protein